MLLVGNAAAKKGNMLKPPATGTSPRSFVGIEFDFIH
jgi:hypothetical protein